MLQLAYEKLRQYDAADMLSTFGGLQLVPQNVRRTLRLEAYAFVAASLYAETGMPPLSLDELKTFLADDGLCGSGIHRAEDPSSNLFTESVMFRGGGYIILPGITTSPHCVVKDLAKALFLSPEPFPDAAVAEEAEQIIGTALAISDAVAKRARLVRWMGVPDSDGEVQVPKNSRLAELTGAVRWREVDIRAEMGRRGMSYSSLESIVVSAAQVALREWDPERSLLARWPIVRIKDELIVAAPGSLVVAAVNAVLDLAAQRQVLPDLAASFNAASWDSAAVSLSHMNLRRPQEVPIQHALNCVRDGFLPIDSDKVMHILVVTDPLDDYKPWQQREPLLRKDVARQIDARVMQVERWLAESFGGRLNDLMHVVVLQGLSRDQVYAFPSETTTFSLGLHLTADDLDIIATKESGNPLALWKFAKARQRLRDRTKVLCFDVADEYAFYVQHGFGYYVGDDARPAVVWFQPGFAPKLRQELQQKQDRHAVLSYDERHVFEVMKRYANGDVPIYFSIKDIGARACLLLEGLPIPVWVLGPLYANDTVAQQHSRYVQIVDSIAYWLWQLSPAITPALEVIAKGSRQLRCLVDLPEADEWDMRKASLRAGPVCAVKICRTDGTRVLSILTGPELETMSDDNAGERVLIAEILRGLRQLLPQDVQELLSEREIAGAVDIHAPLGPKKKYFSVDVAANPSLHHGPGLPDERDIQEADQEAVLDDVGRALTEKGWPVGPVAPARRDKFLQQTVGFLFSRFERIVAGLSPVGLPEILIAHHERLTREWAFLQLTIPTRIACFGNEEEVLRELHARLPRANHLRLALRFLIEYVAARSPQGLRRMSLGVYDELIAIAAEIINFGALSDLCHFQIEDMQWSMLPSGRVGRDVVGYAAKRKAYLDIHAVGQVHRARGSFARHWDRREGEAGEFQDRINAAMVAEVGIPFTAILDVLCTATMMGLQNGDVVSSCGEEDFIKRILTKTALSEGVAKAALKMLVLEPRSSFLDPDGFRREATYPWRLDRALSYIRRPFVVRLQEQGKQLLWGFRNTDQVARYWVEAWLYGRLEAKSYEMKKLVSQHQNERGNAFNNKVAEALEQFPGVIVRRKVKRIGRLQCPGDIDVLLVIPVQRKLRLIECKDLEPARMPHEINSELMKIFKGKNGKPSAIQKHLNRLKWVQQNAESVLDYVGCNDGSTWKAEALFVTDTELLTPFLRESPVRFVPIAEIRKVL